MRGGERPFSLFLSLRRPRSGPLQGRVRLPPLGCLALPPFQGGGVGCFGYELARHLERLPVAAGDDRRFPDLALGFYDVIVAVDCARRRAWIVSSGHPEPDPSARRKRAATRLEAIAA